MQHTTNNNHFIAKLKTHQRADLLPLYEQHAEYLLRVIKTADIADQILTKIDTYIEVATCHEIAINSLSDLDLETHQNRLGKEAEYTNHPKAVNVGRDLRVRLIWTMIKNELEADPALSNYEIYDDLGEHGEIFEIRCPFCDEIIYSVGQFREFDEDHEDGTQNWHYKWDWDNATWDACEHYILYDGPVDRTAMNDEIDDLRRELDWSWGDVTQFANAAQLNDAQIFNYARAETSWHFVEDVDAVIAQMKQKLTDETAAANAED